jgi:hypothetical protein
MPTDQGDPKGSKMKYKYIKNENINRWEILVKETEDRYSVICWFDSEDDAKSYVKHLYSLQVVGK